MSWSLKVNLTIIGSRAEKTMRRVSLVASLIYEDFSQIKLTLRRVDPFQIFGDKT